MSSRKQTGNASALGTKLAVAYLRVSTEDQVLGLDAQRAALESWAQAHGVTVVAWHTDHGVSGAAEMAERPALAAALSDMATLGAAILLVAKRDRLARDVGMAATLDRFVGKLGASIVAADGTGNGDSATDAFIRTIIDATAAYERALIRARTKAALAVKKARGERVGSIPYGYTLAADGVHLMPVQAEQETIAQARELRASGLSLDKVAAELARAGRVSRKGSKFYACQISNMMCA